MSIISPAEAIIYETKNGSEKFKFSHRHLFYTYKPHINLQASKELCDLLYQLSYVIIKEKPENIIEFCQKFCEDLLKKRNMKKKDLALSSCSNVTCSTCTFETESRDNSAKEVLVLNEIETFRHSIIEYLNDESIDNDLTRVEAQTIDYLISSYDQNQLSVIKNYILNDENEYVAIDLFNGVFYPCDTEEENSIKENLLIKLKRNFKKKSF